MNLNITARHLELTPALSDYVNKKMLRLERHLKEIVWAQVILDVEKYRQIANFIVHTPGNTFRTRSESTDLYSAIDLALDKLNLHLTKVKDKKKGHRKKESSRTLSIKEEIFNPLFKRPNIREITHIHLKPLSLTQAIESLNSTAMSFYPFINLDSNRINIIYKNGTQNYAIIETDKVFLK
jgi:putative sigma-54 modulation protein